MMGLLRKGISIVHFDETYFSQRRLLSESHEDIDFQHLMHVNLYCEEDSLRTVKRHLKKRSKKGITFIGSGNYHYVTYVLLKEITEPFTLVLFDNHPDLAMEPKNADMLSCGSWVSFALKELPLMQQVIIIGPAASRARHRKDPRVDIFPFDGNHKYSIKSILSTIQTQNIYISIDKDVINPAEVITNWDQGIMDLNTLTVFLESMLHTKRVEGIDICGEAHISPINTILPDYQAIIHKNEEANLRILQTCF